MDIRKKSIKIVCCYAREDQLFLRELNAHLASLQREGYITLWADINIHPGTEWERELHSRLDEAQMILLLVSADFMASDYCYGNEMKKAMRRHEQREAHVIPVIVRPVVWQDTPLSKLQALPKDANPITKWQNQDEAFVNVVEEIRQIVREALEEENASGHLAFSGGVVDWLHKADAYSQARDYHQALEVYEQVLTLDSTDAAALFGKGNMLWNLNRQKEALAVYEQAFGYGRTPASAQAYYNKGTALLNRQQYREAVQA